MDLNKNTAYINCCNSQKEFVSNRDHFKTSSSRNMLKTSLNFSANSIKLYFDAIYIFTIWHRPLTCSSAFTVNSVPRSRNKPGRSFMRHLGLIPIPRVCHQICYHTGTIHSLPYHFLSISDLYHGIPHFTLRVPYNFI